MKHFVINEAVVHGKYGIGHVNEIEDHDGGHKVVVDFGKAGSKKILGSFLRTPTAGILPYTPPADQETGTLVQLFGCGHVPFVVVSGSIDEYLGVTVARIGIEYEVLEEAFSANLYFHIEDEAPLRRAEHLSRFTSFCVAVGLGSPQDIDEFIGRSACLRVSTPGSWPVFARLAA